MYFSYLRLQLLQVCGHSVRHPAEEHPEGGGHQLCRILHSLARQGRRCRHRRGHRFWMAQGNFCQLESLLLARLNLQHTTWWMVFLIFLFTCFSERASLLFLGSFGADRSLGVYHCALFHRSLRRKFFVMFYKNKSKRSHESIKYCAKENNCTN